jgi:Sec-independent protein translocase protein TatA
LGIFEIILILAVALIVIPTDQLPQVMRSAGKVLRELRLASNTVMREISGAISDEPPYNLLPPRFDDTPPPPASEGVATSITSTASSTSIASSEPSGHASSAAEVEASPATGTSSSAPETAPSPHPASPASVADKR